MIFDIYSEELNSAKQEYVLAFKKQKAPDNSIIDVTELIQSAKNKLLLQGLSKAQIREIVLKNITTPVTTYYSLSAGYIISLHLNEGEYATEGGTIVRVTDLSTLWVKAQLYASQLSQINNQAIASVRFPDLPGKQTTGKTECINTEINSQTRINLLRVNVTNPGNLLKPGMPA